MLGFTRAKEVVATCCFTLVGLGGAYFYGITPPHSFAPPESAQGLLDRADVLSWGNRWAEAKKLLRAGRHEIHSTGRNLQSALCGRKRNPRR